MVRRRLSGCRTLSGLEAHAQVRVRDRVKIVVD
jgi:hypothetical protein